MSSTASVHSLRRHRWRAAGRHVGERRHGSGRACGLRKPGGGSPGAGTILDISEAGGDGDTLLPNGFVPNAIFTQVDATTHQLVSGVTTLTITFAAATFVTAADATFV